MSWCFSAFGNKICVKFLLRYLPQAILMTSGVNSLKMISNLFRKRMTLTYELSELYRPSINRHKDKLIELIKEKAKITMQSDVTRKLRKLRGYCTLEMSVPTSSQEFAKLKADIVLLKEFFKSGCYKYLTVKQAWLLFLVCTEVLLWFFLGETIGKMHIVGYQV